MSERGHIGTPDGEWIVEWDHTDEMGLLTYTVIDEVEGQRYRARYEDGWRIAPEGHTTVDYEMLLRPDGIDGPLVALLDQARAA